MFIASAINGKLVEVIAELPWIPRVPSLLYKGYHIRTILVCDFQDASTNTIAAYE